MTSLLGDSAKVMHLPVAGDEDGEEDDDDEDHDAGHL